MQRGEEAAHCQQKQHSPNAGVIQGNVTDVGPTSIHHWVGILYLLAFCLEFVIHWNGIIARSSKHFKLRCYRALDLWPFLKKSFHLHHRPGFEQCPTCRACINKQWMMLKHWYRYHSKGVLSRYFVGYFLACCWHKTTAGAIDQAGGWTGLDDKLASIKDGTESKRMLAGWRFISIQRSSIQEMLGQRLERWANVSWRLGQAQTGSYAPCKSLGVMTNISKRALDTRPVAENSATEWAVELTGFTVSL